MSRTYNKSIFLNILVVIIILLLGFIILEPRISSRLFPQRRKVVWTNFYTNLGTSIDVKRFWQFREFYSPGNMVFSRSGISKENLASDLWQMGIPSEVLNKDLTFLKYDSDWIISIDNLTKTSSIDDFTKLVQYRGKILKRGNDYILIEQNSKKDILLFLVPASEMEKANGFFDYQDQDKDKVRGKYWLSISQITLN